MQQHQFNSALAAQALQQDSHLVDFLAQEMLQQKPSEDLEQQVKISYLQSLVGDGLEKMDVVRDIASAVGVPSGIVDRILLGFTSGNKQPLHCSEALESGVEEETGVEVRGLYSIRVDIELDEQIMSLLPA